MRKKLFSMLALLCLTAVSAWAQTEQTVDVTPVTGQTNQWTLTMPAGNVVLHVEYEPWLITTQTNNAEWGTVEAVTGGAKEVTPPESWNGDETNLTAADLPGFTAVTEDEAKAWTGAPASGMAFFIYDFDGDVTKYIVFIDGNPTVDQDPKNHKTIYDDSHRTSPVKYYYTGAGSASDVTAGTEAGTYNVVAGKSITLKATPAEGYELEGWYNGTTKIEASDATVIDDEAGTLTLTPEGDMTIEARFAEKTYTVTLTDKTYQTNAHVTATVAGADATITEGTIQGVKAGQTVILKAAEGYKFRKVEAKEGAAAIDLDATITAWTDGSAYKVPAGGLTYSDAITVSGDVTLTLTDGETLTLNKGISLAEGATLTIDGTGTMVVNGTNGSTASTVAGTGTLVLTSGTLTAKGGNGQDTNQGYQNVSGNVGGVAINGAVTVSGGTLTATGGAGGRTNSAYSTASAGGAAISGSVTVSSGTLTATGGNGGNTGSLIGNSHAGAGGAAIGGDLTVNGGTTTTTDGSNGVVEDPGWGDVSGAGGKAVAGTVTDNR